MRVVLAPCKKDLRNKALSKVVLATPALPYARQRTNLFLFVVESLSKDFVTAQSAPNLTEFAHSGCLEFKQTISNSNGSHHAWYSLLQAAFPFYWSKQELKVSKGSRLKPHEADLRCVEEFERLVRELKMNETSSSCSSSPPVTVLVFLESTHHPYWFAHEDLAAPASPFAPFSKAHAYAKFKYSQAELQRLKDRYRNAVFSVDAFLGRALSALRQSEMLENSFVTILRGRK